MANETAEAQNIAWQLEDFIDSLVVDLDKTRETLAVKAINKPLSYSVKDLALDLNIFPSYDGDQVKFVTAQPGQEGASKVTIHLGSITDQQVRATSKMPQTQGDVAIDEINLDKGTKKQLRKLGVNTVDDLKQIEKKNVNLKQVADTDIDYTALANQIEKSRRNRLPPRVKTASLAMEAGLPVLLIQGENLALDPDFQPVAVVNQTLAEVLSSSAREIKLSVGRQHQISQDNEVIVTFDPYAIMKVKVKARESSK